MNVSRQLGTALISFWAVGVMAQVPPVTEPTPVAAPAATSEHSGPVVYREKFCFSTAARRSYVPGYVPQISSSFENPRVPPASLATIATPYYLWAGVPGWFFCSPNGYQSSVPPNSTALFYNRGELGITSHMAYGYPEGMRVIEQVVVPQVGVCKPGGFYIQGGKAPLNVGAPCAVSEAPSAAPVLAEK